MACCCIPCCGGCVAAAPFNTAKWLYLILFAAISVVTWLLRDYSVHILDGLHTMHICVSKSGDDHDLKEDCIGKDSVLRITFASFVFFLGHALALIGVRDKSDPRKYVHSSCWLGQISTIIVLIVLAFLLPYKVFEVWGWIARFAGAAFLLLQLIILIDFAYILNAALLQRGNLVALLATGSALLYLGAGALIIAAGYLYAASASCGIQIFWVFFTPLLGVIVTGLSLSKWRVEQAGLFTGGVICCYAAWLLIAALSSIPHDAKCTRGTPGSTWIQVVGFFAALVALCLNTMSSGTSSREFGFDIEDQSGDEVPYRPDFFHAVFALGAAYMAMVFTGWSLQHTAGEWQVDHGWVSAWIRIVSQWLCYGLYGWTAVAPALLPNRDFR